MHDTGWFKSTRSGGASDACVEVRITGTTARLRDSKNTTGGELMIGRHAFAALVAGAAAAR